MDEPTFSITTGSALNRRWHDLPAALRRHRLHSAAGQWYAWWRDRVDLEAFPAATLGWREVEHGNEPLALPVALTKRRPAPLALPELLNCMADWLFGDTPDFSDLERRYFIKAFSTAGGLDAGAGQSLHRRIYRIADRRAAERARVIERSARTELNHQCRQSVACRGLWLPDPSLSVDEIRHIIDGAFRTKPARPQGQEGAEEMPALLNREEVLIRRYRNPAMVRQHFFGTSVSPARRDWIACSTLRRMGIPVPQPIGLLELLHHGDVTDCYIVARVRPHRGPAKPRTSRGLCHAWLRLLDRGVTHMGPVLPEQPGGLDEEAIFAACWQNLAGLRLGRTALPIGWFFGLRRLQQAAGHLISQHDRRVFLVLLAERWPALRHGWVRRLLGAQPAS